MGVLRDDERVLLHHRYIQGTGSQVVALWSNCCGFGLQARDALVFGPQLWAGWEHMLPGPIWSPHRGNRVTQTDALPMCCLLWHYVRLWCDEYIPYPPLSLSVFFSLYLVLAGQARCSLSGHIMRLWLERLFLLFYSLLTAMTEYYRSWHSWYHDKCWI